MTSKNWPRYLAISIAGVAVVLLLYAMLALPESSDTSDHMGMWGGRTVTTGGLAIVVVASVLLVVAIMFVLMKETYEPLPPSMAPSPPAIAPSRGRVEPELGTKEHRDTVTTLRTEEIAREEYLVLRLLTGDERTMFKAIMDSGGEALQKDLIVRTKMSNAKVSRILDKLEQKGVVSKERHGSTNRVRIKLEQ